MSETLSHVVCCADHGRTLCGVAANPPGGVPGRTCLDCLDRAFGGDCPLTGEPCDAAEDCGVDR